MEEHVSCVLRPKSSTRGRRALRMTGFCACILRRRLAHDCLEVADEVCLVEVAEILSQRGDGYVMAIGQPVRRLMEPVPLNDPFGSYTDVLAEEPLQGSFAHADPVHHVVNASDRAVADDPLDDAVDVI